VKMFDAGKTRMIGLPYGEKKYNNMLSRFHLIPERHGQTDGQTDRQTDRIVISISRVSVLTRDKNGRYVYSFQQNTRTCQTDGQTDRHTNNGIDRVYA